MERAGDSCPAARTDWVAEGIGWRSIAIATLVWLPLALVASAVVEYRRLRL